MITLDPALPQTIGEAFAHIGKVKAPTIDDFKVMVLSLKYYFIVRTFVSVIVTEEPQLNIYISGPKHDSVSIATCQIKDAPSFP